MYICDVSIDETDKGIEMFGTRFRNAFAAIDAALHINRAFVGSAEAFERLGDMTTGSSDLNSPAAKGEFPD